MADTPESLVPLAPGRTSLVGTPVRIPSPAVSALRAATKELGDLERLEASRREQARRDARAGLVLQGATVLEGAREAAMQETDPERLGDTYRETVGDQMEKIRETLTDDQDLRLFDLQMGNRQLSHDIELGARELELKRERRLATKMNHTKLILDGSLTADPQRSEMLKNEHRAMLEGEVAMGTVPASDAEKERILIASRIDANRVMQLAQEGEYQEALAALRDRESTPDLLPEARQRLRQAVTEQRSNARMSEISVEIDRWNELWLGRSGQVRLDDEHDRKILTDTDWRQLSSKSAAQTGAYRQRIECGHAWDDFTDRGVPLNLNSKCYHDAVQVGFDEYRQTSQLGPVEAAKAFTVEYGHVPPSAWDFAVTQLGDRDLTAAAQGANLVMFFDTSSARNIDQLRQNRIVSDELDTARLYFRLRTGMKLTDVAGAVDIDKASGVQEELGLGAAEKMSPADAMKVARSMRAPPGSQKAIWADRYHRHMLTYGEDEGLDLALRAFNRTSHKGFFDFDLEDPQVRGVLEKIRNRAIVRMTDGQFGTDEHGYDEQAAFLAAAEDVVNDPDRRSIDASTFNGTRQVMMNPPERFLDRAVDSDGDDLAYRPHRAEVPLQLAVEVSRLIRGDGTDKRAVAHSDALWQVAQEFLADPDYIRGEVFLPAVPLPAAPGVALPITRHRSAYLGPIIDAWADRLGIERDDAWLRFNRALFSDDGPGTTPWEPELYGDAMTVGAGPTGPAPLSWQIGARTAGDFLVPITSRDSPQGMRIQFGTRALNPLLRQPTQRDVGAVLDAGRATRAVKERVGMTEEQEDIHQLLMQPGWEEVEEEAAPEAGRPPLPQALRSTASAYRELAGFPGLIERIADVKPGASVAQVKPEMFTAVYVMSAFSEIHGLPKPTITSGTDRPRGYKGESFHPVGYAVDFRTKDEAGKVWPPELRGKAMTYLQSKLGRFGFEVIVKGDHIHVEYEGEKSRDALRARFAPAPLADIGG